LIAVCKWLKPEDPFGICLKEGLFVFRAHGHGILRGHFLRLVLPMRSPSMNSVKSMSYPFTISSQQELIGGTGKYAGATGTATGQATGSFLAVGSKDGIFGGFGPFTFTTDGTLILPKHNEE